jgi:hypothetical protein
MANSQSLQKVSSLQTPYSRYISTKVFIDQEDENRVFFGTWAPPKIYETMEPSYHVVTADEIARPDLIAYRVYKDPNLWWVIALRNNIGFPLIDLTAGTVLTCPNINDISAAVSAHGNNTLAR